MTQDAAYFKKWRHDRYRGIARTVPEEPVRLHIATLVGAGMSLRSIAASVGTSASVISRIHTRGQKVVSAPLAARIQALQPSIIRKASQGTTEPFVPKVGAVRRIQALLALGWTHEQQYDRCGIRTHLILSQQGRWITLTTHDAIAGMYEALSMTPGPSARTRGRAAARGYAPPLAWDDIDTDEVPATDRIAEEDDAFDEVAIERRMGGDKTVRLTPDERLELVRRWHAAGRALNDLERVTGINSHRHLKQAS